MDAAPNFGDILQVLRRHEVALIVVGGVAAIVQGAPVSTFDLDVVVETKPENRSRLLSALESLHARYLDPAGRHIVPDAGKLESMRIHRLLTDFGPLDVLVSIGDNLGYADLVEQTFEYELGGATVLVLSLEMVIRSKEQAHRDKDQAALPILKRTLRLRSKS